MLNRSGLFLALCLFCFSPLFPKVPQLIQSRELEWGPSRCVGTADSQGLILWIMIQDKAVEVKSRCIYSDMYTHNLVPNKICVPKYIGQKHKTKVDVSPKLFHPVTLEVVLESTRRVVWVWRHTSWYTVWLSSYGESDRASLASTAISTAWPAAVHWDMAAY